MKITTENNAAKALFKVIAYSPAVAKVTGSIKFAVLWGQIKYWSDKTRDHDGWVYKSQIELFDEIGMSRKESDTARALGAKLGVMRSEVRGTPPTVHYLIDEDKMIELLDIYLEKNNSKFKKEQKVKREEIVKEFKLDKVKTIVETNYPEWLNVKAWEDWVEYRKQSGKKLTELTIKKQIDLLSNFKSQQVEIIDNSIRNGWQGLFAPKKDFTKMPTDQDIRREEKRKVEEKEKQDELAEMSRPKTPEEIERTRVALKNARESLSKKFIMPTK